MKRSEPKGLQILDASLLAAILISLVLLGLLRLLVVPKFQEMFQDFGGSLPVLTKIVFDNTLYLVMGATAFLTSILGFVLLVMHHQVIGRLCLATTVVLLVCTSIVVLVLHVQSSFRGSFDASFAGEGVFSPPR